MKKKFIGIPIFLYLLLSVNITTCATTKPTEKAQAQKAQAQASTKPIQKAHPKFKKAIHEELLVANQCILKQIASDSRIDIADHKTIIENYANFYLNKTTSTSFSFGIYNLILPILSHANTVHL